MEAGYSEIQNQLEPEVVGFEGMVKNPFLWGDTYEAYEVGNHTMEWMTWNKISRALTMARDV